MSRILVPVVLLIAVGLGSAWWLSRPQIIEAGDLPDHVPDAVAGERMFWAGGCASCHATPVDGKRARGADKLNLGGGLELDTGFGIFRVPNISPHETDGIGRWTLQQFVTAMQRGVSPSGLHYYPSFPYVSYARLSTEDVLDLHAFLRTLPPIEGRIAGHELAFPWSVRRGIGLWKRRYFDPSPVAGIAAGDEQLRLGQLLVEGAGHCGECHTPRDRFGGLLRTRWLAGAPSLEGEGSVPNITPAGKDVSAWSAADLAYYFESGFTPDYDTVGGSMVAVQESLAMLTSADREAIAAYLKGLPPIE